MNKRAEYDLKWTEGFSKYAKGHVQNPFPCFAVQASNDNIAGNGRVKVYQCLFYFIYLCISW